MIYSEDEGTGKVVYLTAGSINATILRWVLRWCGVNGGYQEDEFLSHNIIYTGNFKTKNSEKIQVNHLNQKIQVKICNSGFLISLHRLFGCGYF